MTGGLANRPQRGILEASLDHCESNPLGIPPLANRPRHALRPHIPGQPRYSSPSAQGHRGRGAVAATAPLASTVAADASPQPCRTSVVLNPYDGVDWRTCGRHKAALHLHTLQSDGYHSVVEVVDAYRKAGFEIMSITDHDWNHPNARIEWKHLPPEKASPYPKGPRPANFPADPTWPWTDYGCAEPSTLGMVGIQGNELTFRHHINSYFSDYGVWYTRTGSRAPYGGIVDATGHEVWEDDQLLAIRDKGGLAVINHPGIPSLHAWWERKPLGWYVEPLSKTLGRLSDRPGGGEQRAETGSLRRRSLGSTAGPVYAAPADLGIRQRRHASDEKRPPGVYGLFLDRLDQSTVRKAMESGRFCVCTSTKTIDYGKQPADGSVFPKLVSVAVDETAGTIHLEVSDCDQVRWISSPESLEPVEDYKTSDRPWPQGRLVHVGDTLHYRQVAGLHNYVRAELCRAEGQDTHRTLTNPFGIGMAAIHDSGSAPGS